MMIQKVKVKGFYPGTEKKDKGVKGNGKKKCLSQRGIASSGIVGKNTHKARIALSGTR